MQDVDVVSLISLVLWGGFAAGVLFGAVAQHTHFCTMGALSDLVTMGDDTRLRMWVLAIAVAMLGFNGMAAMGLVDAVDTVYARPQLIWLSNLVGGALFGFGMVLASGCGSKTLVRIGGGSLKSLVVFFVLGVAAYATLRGLTAVWRVETIDRIAVELPAGQDLVSLAAHAVGGERPALSAVLGGVLGLAMLAWVLARPQGRDATTLLGGVGVGAAVVIGWWVTGSIGFVAEHPETLEETFLATNSRSMESLTFVAPVAYTLDWLILYSDTSKVLTFGIVSVLGVIVRSAAMALASGRLRGAACVRSPSLPAKKNPCLSWSEHRTQ